MSATGEPIRVGLLGTGAIAQVVHAPILAEREDVDLAVLADADVHKAETLSRRFGVPLVMDPVDLLKADDVDAIVLCTPNHLHEDAAVTALEYGKHVFVERPIAADSAGAARVVEAARRAGKLLVVGMPHRFRPEVAALRSFVAGGELGKLYSARASWMTRPAPAARRGWRQNLDEAGGGALVDIGIPALDLLLWIVGFPEIERVSCVVGDEDSGLEGAATLMARTVDGMGLTLEVTNRLFAGEDRYHAHVLGTEGSGSLPPLEVFKQLGGRPIEVTPRQPTPRGGENPYKNAYRRLLDEFVRGISGQCDIPLPEEQIRLMALIEAAYTAAKTGREVKP